VVRRYARAPKGERAYGSRVPRQPQPEHHAGCFALARRGRRDDGFSGSDPKTAVFENFYVEQVLTPSLGLEQVVVVDNLGAHKGKRVNELIEARGAVLVFLPAYPPDFSLHRGHLFHDKGATKQI
jgi:hypothetical protein